MKKILKKLMMYRGDLGCVNLLCNLSVSDLITPNYSNSAKRVKHPFISCTSTASTDLIGMKSSAAFAMPSFVAKLCDTVDLFVQTSRKGK